MSTSKASSLIGELLPDISLSTSEGSRTRVSDYRGRRNLVILVAGEVSGQRPGGYLGQVAHRYAEFVSEEAEILALILGTTEEAKREKRTQNLPFPVLADEQGQAHRVLAAHDSGGAARQVVVADRYGEIFNVWRTAEGDTLPTVDEILDWLHFINLHCPECGIPHWPV